MIDPSAVGDEDTVGDGVAVGVGLPVELPGGELGRSSDGLEDVAVGSLQPASDRAEAVRTRSQRWVIRFFIGVRR